MHCNVIPSIIWNGWGWGVSADALYCNFMKTGGGGGGGGLLRRYSVNPFSAPTHNLYTHTHTHTMPANRKCVI